MTKSLRIFLTKCLFLGYSAPLFVPVECGDDGRDGGAQAGYKELRDHLTNVNREGLPFRNVSKSWAERVDDLVGRLTLQVSRPSVATCCCEFR